MDGGDVWSGVRVSKDELQEVIEIACTSTIKEPIIAQYYPGRWWLWRQWGGTILRRVLPRDVVFNVLFACLVVAFFHAPGPHAARRAAMLGKLSEVQRVWQLSATMTSFTLSFFLSQSYSLWRSVYGLTRRVQGRLNDVGLLCATFATRAPPTGRYTPEADALLADVARYVRLYSLLFFASVTTRFAPLSSPNGLSALVEGGHLTAAEREGLLASSMGHFAVLQWLSALFDSAIADGRLSVSAARASGTYPIAVQLTLQTRIVELRGTSASIPDELAGRMPLAYVQLVQILSDVLCFFTPLALLPHVGAIGAVCATATVTLFQSSIVNLAKLFLDPLNNEAQQRGGDAGIGGISTATLLQEINVGSERWRRSASYLPEAAYTRHKEPPRHEEGDESAQRGGEGAREEVEGYADDGAAALLS